MNRPIVAVTILYVLIIVISASIKPFFIKERDRDFEREIVFIGIVDDEPGRTDAGVSFTLRTKYVKSEKYRPFSSLVSVYLCSSEGDVRYGDLIKVKGLFSTIKGATNPGEADFRDYFAKRGVIGKLLVFSSKGKTLKVLAHNRGDPFIAFCQEFKKRVFQVFDSTIPRPYSTLFGSVIFGIKSSPIPPEMKASFQRAGVIHILVASGQQVSILIGVVLAFGRLLGIPVPLSVVLASLSMWSFAMMAGMGASIVRAAIMGQIVIAGQLLKRETDFYTSLALAALVLLVIDPGNLFDIGFQLSFLATWALVYISPILEKFFSQFIPKLLSSLLSVAIPPVLVTTPISLYNFSQISFVAVFANIIAVPAAEILTTLGFVSAFLGFIFFPAAKVLNGFIFIVIFAVNTFIGYLSSFPLSYAYMQRPLFLFVLLYYAVIMYFIELIRKDELLKMFNKHRMKAGWLFSVLIFCLFFCPNVLADKQLILSALDVGQGDSILIQMPGGENILVDGSTGKKARVIEDVLHKKGINSLDMVVLTHPHDDHLGGLLQVMTDIKTKSVLDSSFPNTSPQYLNFLRLIQKNKIKYFAARAGEVFKFGPVNVQVIAPFNEEITGTESDANNNSVVLRVVYGNTSFLLMGDAAFEEEEKILSFWKNIKSDVIKIGHHGSRTSTCDDLLRSVSPKEAIISVGAQNRYGHPSNSTLERLFSRAIKVFRTDQSGAIVLTSDGKKISTSF